MRKIAPENIQDIRLWQTDGHCWQIGYAAWDRLDIDAKIRVCRGCPALRTCHDYADEIHACEEVFGGAYWRGGRPSRHYKALPLGPVHRADRRLMAADKRAALEAYDLRELARLRALEKAEAAA